MSSVYCIESDTTYPDLASFESAEQGAVAKTAVIDGKVTGAEIKNWTGHLTLKAKNTPYNGANSATCDGLTSRLTIRSNNVTLSKDSPIFVDGVKNSAIILGTWEDVQNVFISGGCRTDIGSSTAYAIRSYAKAGSLYHIDNFIVEQSGAGIDLVVDATGSTINQLTVAQSAANQSYRRSLSDKSNAVVTNLLVVRDAAAVLNDIFMAPVNPSSDYLATGDSSSTGYAATSSFLSTEADLVDIAGGNFNVSPSSPLYTAGPNGEPVGAVLEVDLGGEIVAHDLISSVSSQLIESGVLSLSQWQRLQQQASKQRVYASVTNIAKQIAFAPVKSSQAQASSFTEILQENLLSVASSAQHIELSTVDLLIDNALTIASSAQATESSLVSLLSGTQLITLSTQQVVASLVSAIAQQQLLAPVNTAQAICSSTANINADAIFVLHNSEQKIVSTTADINHVKQWITTSTEQQVNSSVLSAFEIKQLTTISSAQRVQLQRIIQATGLMPDIDLDKITIISLTPTYIVKSRTPRYIIQ